MKKRKLERASYGVEKMKRSLDEREEFEFTESVDYIGKIGSELNFMKDVGMRKSGRNETGIELEELLGEVREMESKDKIDGSERS